MGPPDAQIAQVLAVGWSPVLDVGQIDISQLGPGAQQCEDEFAKVGIPAPANLGEVASSLATCTNLNVVAALVAQVPGALDRTAMLASLAAAKGQISLLVGSTDFSLGRQPVSSFRPVIYDTAAKAFAYDGDAKPFPT
jgi:hypothetical protein